MEEPMSTKIEIPDEVIPDVREALLCCMGDAAEEIATAVARRDRALHPEWLAPGRDMFERACELLDLIGWDGTPRPQSASVPLGEHGATLISALEGYLPLVETELEEVEVDGAERARPGEHSGREAVARRAVALRELATLVQGLSTRRIRPHRY
jgi:hypothetical protein